MMRLARNKLQKELLRDLKREGKTKRLNEYVWQNGEQKYRVGFAIKAVVELVEMLQKNRHNAEYVKGRNGGEVTGYINLT